MGKAVWPSCWHQNFVPWGLSVPAPGLYTCIKSWRKLYKIRLQRHFFETCNKWMKWQYISVDIKILSPGGCLPLPWGLSAPALGLYTCIKSWKKNVSNQTWKRLFWNLQQMTEETRCSCWHQNFIPKGLSAPALGLYTCIKSWKKNCIKSDSKEIFLKFVANDGSDKRFLLTSKFCPLGLSTPDLQLNTWKDVYKVRDWKDSF